MSTRTAIATPDAPQAIGPYSQAISVHAAGRLIFCSGQIALSPQTGQLVGAGDVQQQTTQVLDNLRAVLAAAGADLSHVVKTTLFLADLSDFGRVNEIYGRCFAERPPARSTVQAAGLPRGALVEIEAVAVIP